LRHSRRGFVCTATTPAHAVPIKIDFTLSGGGDGYVQFDYTGLSTTIFRFSDISNFAASFTIGTESWDEAGLFGKYSTWLNDPRAFLRDNGADGWDWFWDDTYNGTNDTAIIGFDNGNSILTFDEGDGGSRNYRIDGQIAGRYSAHTAAAPAPAAAVLMVIGLTGIGFARRLRKT